MYIPLMPKGMPLMFFKKLWVRENDDSKLFYVPNYTTFMGSYMITCCKAIVIPTSSTT
jgi:hypothetical protein